MVFQYCHCCRFLAGRSDAATNFYRDHFIPERWELCYSKLSECSGVFLAGRCEICSDKLAEFIPIQEGLSGDALFQAIYDTMQTAHPYDKKDDALGYYGSCKERSRFYDWRDRRPQLRRSKEFLDLFNDWDREAARLWMEKNFPPEKPTQVFRDTGGSLFSSVIRMAKANGDFAKAEPILDYILPREDESDIGSKVKLTDYQFDFVPVVNYGGEGIYIDCSLKGKFDESGRSSLHVGTLKTLNRDLESAKIMGELCGALMHHASEYVNRRENLHRYTPEQGTGGGVSAAAGTGPKGG